MNSSGAELLRPSRPNHARRRGRGGSPDVRHATGCACGRVKTLEDGRPSDAGGPEGRPALARRRSRRKTGRPKAVLREIMTTLGVKIGKNTSCTTLPGNQATTFAAFYDGYTGDRSKTRWRGFL